MQIFVLAEQTFLLIFPNFIHLYNSFLGYDPEACRKISKSSRKLTERNPFHQTLSEVLIEGE